MTERPQPLDELVLTVVVDNETDTLSSVDPGVPQLPEMASLMRRTDPIHRAGHDLVTAFDQLCVACHGFSVLVTGRSATTPAACCSTSARTATCGSPTRPASASIWPPSRPCSCRTGTGTTAAACPSPSTRSRRPVEPPASPRPSSTSTPTDPTSAGSSDRPVSLAMLPDEPTFEAIEDVGGRVERHAEPHLLAGGRFLGSGAIPRRTPYETGLAGHHTRRGDELVPDPLIMDERFLAAEVRGRGVTVLSACSHAGIVNACLGVRDHFPDRRSTSCSVATTSPARRWRGASRRRSTTSTP